MTDEQEPPAPRSALEWLDIAAKSALVFLALSYVAGLLIVNFRLGDVAASYFSFPQSQYVLSGALWVVLCTLAYSLVEPAVISAMRAWRQTAATLGRKILVILLTCVAFPAALFFIWLYVWTVLVEAGAFRMGPVSPALVALLICFAGGIALFHGHDKHARLIREGISHIRRGAPLTFGENNPLFVIGYRVFLFVVMLRLFSAAVFPLLPPSIGGGRPLAAEIILKGEHIELAKSLGIPTGYGGSIGRQAIIAETPDYFLLTAQDAIKGPEQRERSVRIAKDHVDAVIYLWPNRQK